MKRHKPGVLDHLRIIASEGLELSALGDNAHFEYYDALLQKEIHLDGSLGLVNTENCVYIPASEVINDEEAEFLGVLAFRKNDHIPYATDQDGDKLMNRSHIRPRFCRREHFTEEAWAKYKPEIRKKQAQIAVVGGSVITAVAVTAGVLWRSKKSK